MKSESKYEEAEEIKQVEVPKKKEVVVKAAAKKDVEMMEIPKAKNTNCEYTPIKSLNTFLYEWKIKARVQKKGDLKHWNNSKGSGTLLNIELIDNYNTQI